MIVKVERDGLTIKVNGVVCPVVKQESKGPNKEVANIERVVGPTYQKYLSLSTLKEGEQDVELKERRQVVLGQKYVLTQEEQSRIDKLQSEIDSIIEGAKKRYVPSKINLNMDISKLSEEQRLEEIAKVMKYIEALKA